MEPFQRRGSDTEQHTRRASDTGQLNRRATDVMPGFAATQEAGTAGPRPSVIQLSIREKAALYAAYMSFVDGGGLFVPTTRTAQLGDEVYALLTLMDEPAKVPIPGKVCWITPAGVPGRQQGLGIQFANNEAGAQARIKIENLIGTALRSSRPTHTL